MASTDTAVTKGGGDANSGPGLPQGEATALNDVAAYPTVGPPEPDMMQPEPLAEPAAPESTYRPAAGNVAEDILFGDPDPGTQASFGLQLAPGRLPESVVRSLPLMKAAAEDPTSPPALKAIYEALVNQLETDLRG
jgi:hypothetical protein